MDLHSLDWLERFFRHLVLERRLSPLTHKSYRLDLETLVRFCDKAGIQEWAALDARQVQAFAGRQRVRGLGSRSIQRHLSAVRTFMSFLMRENVLTYNAAKDVRGPKFSRPLPRVLDVDTMTVLIESPEPGGAHYARDRAMLELLYSSGLRLAELVGLNVTDLDLRERLVRVMGKGSRERVVPVGRMAATALTEYLRRRKGKRGETALFLSRRGTRLQCRAVQMCLKRWARKAGIRQHVNPHLFRHSCATHLLESSRDIRAVQELLGHASLSTTAIYTHLDAQHLLNVYMATHPRAKRVTNQPGVEANEHPEPARRVVRPPSGGDRTDLPRLAHDGEALEARQELTACGSPDDADG